MMSDSFNATSPLATKAQIQPRRLGLLAALTVPLLFGCASMQARKAVLREQTQAHRYQSSPEHLISEAKSLLFERGYVVNDSTDRDFQTDWMIDETSQQRYLVRTECESAPGCAIHFTMSSKGYNKNTGEWSHEHTSESWRMALELMQRLAPEDAARIRAEAERAAQAAQ